MRECMSGTYAEYAIVDSADVCLKPPGLPHCQAAAVPHACLAAYAALAHVGGLHKRRGQDGAVLVLGGSGGVGSFAVQLARRHFGCFTAASCSARNARFVRALGAHAALDYAAGDFLAAVRGRRFDVVVDCVGGDDYWDAARGLLKPHGTYVTLVGAQRHLADRAPLDYPDMLQIKAGYLVRQLSSSLGAAQKYHILTGSQMRSADLPALAALLHARTLRVPPGRAFALREVREAHALSESHRAVGKLVLLVRADPDWGDDADWGDDSDWGGAPAAAAMVSPAGGRDASGSDGQGGLGRAGGPPVAGRRLSAEYVTRDAGPRPDYPQVARTSFDAGPARLGPSTDSSPRGRTPAHTLPPPPPPRRDAAPPPHEPLPPPQQQQLHAQPQPPQPPP